MDYCKHYFALIDRARNTACHGYSEKHHILPKCLGGTNESSNIVELRPEEHYLAHQLLVKMYPNNLKLLKAAVIMCTDKNGNRNNNKIFGWLRRRLSELSTGRTLSVETRAKMSASRTGKSVSDTTKKKISESLTGSKYTEERRINISASLKGNIPWNKGIKTGPISEEQRKSLSILHSGRVTSEETKKKQSEANKKWRAAKKELTKCQ